MWEAVIALGPKGIFGGVRHCCCLAALLSAWLIQLYGTPGHDQFQHEAVAQEHKVQNAGLPSAGELGT